MDRHNGTITGFQWRGASAVPKNLCNDYIFVTVASLNVSLKNEPDKDVVFIYQQTADKRGGYWFFLVHALVRLPQALSHSIAAVGGGKKKNSLQDLKFRDLQLYSWKQNYTNYLFLPQMCKQLARQTPTTFHFQHIWNLFILYWISLFFFRQGSFFFLWNGHLIDTLSTGVKMDEFEQL